MARIVDAYWRFERRFSRPPTRSQRFSARHPVLIGMCAGAIMSAVLLPAALGAGNGVAYGILASLLGGVPLGAVFCGFCFLERKRQRKLFGDR